MNDSTRFRVANVIALLCADIIGVAFVLFPWFDVGIFGKTTALNIAVYPQLVSLLHPELVHGMPIPYFLPFALALVGGLAGIWGIFRPSSSATARLVSLLPGLAGLAFYAYFVINTYQDWNLVGPIIGTGFWVILLGSIGLTLQAIVPPERYVGYLRQVQAGDLGSLPIIFGLFLIAVIFQSLNLNFITANNFVNLITQLASITAIAYGVVFVLLLGEIDLSIGYVGGVASVVMTLMLRPPTTTTWFEAILVALVIGMAIGFLHGFIITFFQVPSFIVTLAGLLAWNGVVLLVIGGNGTVIIQDPVINGIANSYLPPTWGWIAAAIFVVGFAVSQYLDMNSRRAKGLTTKSMSLLTAEVVGLAILLAVIVYVSNSSRFTGIPVVGVVLIILLVGLTYVAQSTRFGRYVYAVGGNKEASRRAGIRVERIRIYVFMISSTMAAVGGIIAASRLRSVATNTGGGDILLNSIASAVIGGTSLFGGRGMISSAVLGALVIASVSNGMGLLGLSSGVQFVVTGLVLLAAVIVDALSRRSQKQAGLA